MEWQQVPPVLAEVVAPLKEADDYRRLQLQRQRGVYNLLTGLPGFFFLFMFGHLPTYLGLGFGFPMLAWGGFFWACSAPKSLLPFIRRRRPDWESPLVDSYLLNKALEKQFWLQAPVVFGIWILLPFLLLISFLTDWGPDWIVLASGQVIMLTVFAGALALQCRRRQDRLVAAMYWLTALLSPLLFLAPRDFVTGFVWMGLVVVAPPLIAAAFRLLAPRRWLVH